MNRSIIRRLAGGFAAAALAVTTLGLTGAAPAQATDSRCTTQTFVTVNNSYANRTLTYGQTATIHAWTVINGCSGGSYNPPAGYRPDAGSLVIQRSADGRSWQTVARGGTLATYHGNVPRSMLYRAVYAGGQNSDRDVFGASSDRLSVAAKRKVAVVDRSTSRSSRGFFKISPPASIRGMYVKFQVRRSGGWRAYKRVRVPADGNFTTSFRNSRRGIKYRMVAPAGRGFVGSVTGPFTATRR
jgi:hypothetical protein